MFVLPSVVAPVINLSMLIGKNKLEQSGITLVEVLVSLFIFSVALSALLFLMTNLLTSADELRNNTIAAGLAQEGLEVVRNIRDQNWLGGVSFFNGVTDGDYEVQWDSTSLVGSTASYLKKDPATGIFSYSGGSNTRFKRTITILTISPSEKSVKVVVSWLASGGISKNLFAESHLFDWYQP